MAQKLKLRSIKEHNFANKTVLLRVDFNVPVLHGKTFDLNRIKKVLPSINYLLEQKAKVVLISHFRRPKGKFDIKMSLSPLVDVLAELLPNRKVNFAIDSIGTVAKSAIDKANYGELTFAGESKILSR